MFVNSFFLLKDHFLGTSSSVDEQIQRLMALHRVFELFSLMKIHVPTIPFESMRRLVRESLELFHDLGKTDEVVVFTLPLPKYSSGTSNLITAICHRHALFFLFFSQPFFSFSDSLSVVDSLEPILWSATLSTAKGTELSVFRLSKKDPLFRAALDVDLNQADLGTDFITVVLLVVAKKSLFCRYQGPRGDRQHYSAFSPHYRHPAHIDLGRAFLNFSFVTFISHTRKKTSHDCTTKLGRE